MAYRLKRSETAARSLRRILLEQLDAAVRRVNPPVNRLAPDAVDPRPEADPHAAVHDVRRHAKMIRAALRLARPHLGKRFRQEHDRVRDAAERLSEARDAQALLESMTTLMEGLSADDADRYYAIRQALVYRRDQITRQMSDLPRRLDAFAEALAETRDQVAEWTLRPSGFDLIAPGLGRVYRAGRSAMKQAYENPSAASFHEFRKRVKELWYALRMLRPLYPPVTTIYRDLAGRLGNTLGQAHDLDILEATLRTETVRFATLPNVQALLEEIDRKRNELRTEARIAGRLLYAEKSGAFVRRFAAYWRYWKAKGKPSKVKRERDETQHVARGVVEAAGV